jgi:hypothetical protein
MRANVCKRVLASGDTMFLPSSLFDSALSGLESSVIAPMNSA